MRIGDVDLAERVLIVAEIGNNHEGDFAVAERLVEQAAACGAGAVKLQTFVTEHYVSSSDAERFARLKRFELPPAQFAALAERARACGLIFLSTPFDLASADALEPIVDAYKISSGDNSFRPLLERVARTGKPLIVSAGLCELSEIEEAVAFVRGVWAGAGGELAVLHCVSSYPVEPAEANLLAIEVLRERLPCTVGYSDHTVGLDAAPLAVALGARIVEKHFTLDKRHSDFRDHQLSADPADLRELVRRVRLTETMLGRRAKEVQPSERPALTALRRSIAAATDLPAGSRVESPDLTWVRPGGGLPPGEERLLLGKTLVRDVRAGELLSVSDVA